MVWAGCRREENLVRAFFVIWLLLAACCAGCSQSIVVEKTTVSGTVTYNGQPVEKGEIRFLPKSGTAGPLASGAIVDGKYTVTAAGGVPVGTHKVEIVGHGELPKPANAPPIAPTPREQYIPAKYNTSSELECSVASSGNVTQDFKLDGPPRKSSPAPKLEAAP